MKFGIHDSSWLDTPDPAEAFKAVRAKAQWAEGHGFVGTVSEATDLIGQYRDADIDQLINADRRNDTETRELFASDVMAHFA
jgi:hypothetical protein